MKRLLAALVVVGAVVSASCSAESAGSDEAGPTGDATAEATPTTEPQLPDPPPYRPMAGEPALEVKQLAAAAVQAIGTYDMGEGTPDAARRRLAGLAVAPAVADQAAALLVAGSASSIEIVYPQLGGLTETEASIMVVVRHRVVTGEADEERLLTRTVDVRAARGARGWSVSQIASTGGAPVEAVAPSPAAEAVLASDNIDLPDSARWDIEAGRVDDRVLQVLADVAARYTVSVTVLASGHPANVFATDVASNHTSGRGVDIWAVNGQPVVSLRDPAGPLHRLVTELLATGLTELGSPWDLDGPGSRVSFTNTVHQDHLHLAYDA